MTGPVDLAAIPIGSYEPRWHMHLQHTDPEGAVRMAQDMNIKKSIPVHWGTWLMSDEACELARKSTASTLLIVYRQQAAYRSGDCKAKVGRQGGRLWRCASRQDRRCRVISELILHRP